MDRRQISTKLAIDKLGLDGKMDSFMDRLILQKSIYLAQEKGVHLGYFFGWYLRGPYCPALTTDAFAIQAETAEGYNPADQWELDQKSILNLETLRTLFADKDREKLARSLELLASVHFLVSRKQVKENTASLIEEVLKKYGKHFTCEEIEAAKGNLASVGLL